MMSPKPQIFRLAILDEENTIIEIVCFPEFLSILTSELTAIEQAIKLISPKIKLIVCHL